MKRKNKLKIVLVHLVDMIKTQAINSLREFITIPQTLPRLKKTLICPKNLYMLNEEKTIVIYG